MPSFSTPTDNLNIGCAQTAYTPPRASLKSAGQILILLLSIAALRPPACLLCACYLPPRLQPRPNPCMQSSVRLLCKSVWGGRPWICAAHRERWQHLRNISTHAFLDLPNLKYLCSTQRKAVARSAIFVCACLSIFPQSALLEMCVGRASLDLCSILKGIVGLHTGQAK